HGAQSRNGFVVFAFRVRDPSRGFLIILFGGLCELGLLFGQQLFSDALDLLEILLRSRDVAAAGRADSTGPVGDGVIACGRTVDWRESRCVAPVAKFKT